MLRPRMVVTFAPTGLTSVILEIEGTSYEQHDEASFDNDVVAFRVANVATKVLKRGMVMGEANNESPKWAESFKALVKT